jgi:hypothetical protein
MIRSPSGCHDACCTKKDSLPTLDAAEDSTSSNHKLVESGELAWYRIFVPSGDHRGRRAGSRPSVISRACPPRAGSTQIFPSRSIAIRPSAGNTSTPKLVPCVTMTSAHTDLTSSRAQSKPVNCLSGTSHLQIREIAIIYFKTYLHRLTANLAVFNIRLSAATKIQQNADRFRTERATDIAFHDTGVHG